MRVGDMNPVYALEPPEWRDYSDAELKARIDPRRLPRHIAVIMDGNGRWAQARGLPRISGHRAGIQSVRETVEGAAELGIPVLTLFAFSTENWRRPKDQVDALMDLLVEYVDREIGTLIQNDIRFIPIGRLFQLPPHVQAKLAWAQEQTAHARGLLFLIALSYSGRVDIVDAVREIARQVQTGRLLPDCIDEQVIAVHLYTRGVPDPDLLIRTSGELRISNFMLWQLAYTELWFTPIYWPDFRKRHLYMAILDFQRRERRYGTVPSTSEPVSSGTFA
jgi:undecaprenyl diphosphate synthase